jgi:uncharacterized protein YigE (DUF2233 family)
MYRGIVLLAVSAVLAGNAAASGWRQLEQGLALGQFAVPQSTHGDSTVTVLRIDPAHFELRLLNASAPGQGRKLPASQWAKNHALVAAINASMFQTDHRTSVALMTTAGHTNSPHLSKDKAVLAFDRTSPVVPAVQIIDRTCDDFGMLRKHYNTLVQNIRMVSCDSRNVWAQQKRRSSIAAVGMDKDGCVLFIHCRSPYTTHDFINILLNLPIDLKNAMYVEGGRQAQLYVEAGGAQLELVGGFETGAHDSQKSWPIPNVIGVARKARGMARGVP